MTTDFTHDWIAKREQLEQAATEGPWSAGQLEGVDYGSVLGPTIEREGCAVTETLVDDLSRYEGTAEFIADARTALPTALAALRAVLELHKPGVGVSQGWTSEGYGDIEPYCAGCEASDEYAVEWPCPTVTAITTALKGES